MIGKYNNLSREISSLEFGDQPCQWSLSDRPWAPRILAVHWLEDGRNKKRNPKALSLMKSGTDLKPRKGLWSVWKVFGCVDFCLTQPWGTQGTESWLLHTLQGQNADLPVFVSVGHVIKLISKLQSTLCVKSDMPGCLFKVLFPPLWIIFF